ncbi:hypothetical protein Cni_G00852 [Canna indica]|uniref:Uncharacterized protein n=1 Tax=Canna indica TaxID=4628 RepID=A0AAQ3JM17_9LILI|nr:hypothetical protein Cni_G00852 [Canna indica]
MPMSLTLLQGYSSEEEEDARVSPSSSSASLGDDGGDREEVFEDEEEALNEHPRRGKRKKSLEDASDPPANSFLPSALDAFDEITGPPEFLNNCAAAPEETREALGVLDRRAKNKSKRDKKGLPAGVVVEAKAQLVGIRERVRDDVEGSCPTSTSNITPGGKHVISATNPDPKDAAELLRLCLQCGVPKTYSHNRGMVCPVCGDRPPSENTNESEKKKGSVVKEKEKLKRMKGQSSHATWKSETEMQLRQQFD